MSNCQPFIACLSEIRGWSRAHPDHVPIYILVETKTQEALPDVPGMASPEPWTSSALGRAGRGKSARCSPPRRSSRRTRCAVLIARFGRRSFKAVGRRLRPREARFVFLLDQTNVTATYVVGPSLARRPCRLHQRRSRSAGRRVRGEERWSAGGDHRLDQTGFHRPDPRRRRHQGKPAPAR